MINHKNSLRIFICFKYCIYVILFTKSRVQKKNCEFSSLFVFRFNIHSLCFILQVQPSNFNVWLLFAHFFYFIFICVSLKNDTSCNKNVRNCRKTWCVKDKVRQDFGSVISFFTPFKQICSCTYKIIVLSFIVLYGFYCCCLFCLWIKKKKIQKKKRRVIVSRLKESMAIVSKYYHYEKHKYEWLLGSSKKI